MSWCLFSTAPALQQLHCVGGRRAAPTLLHYALLCCPAMLEKPPLVVVPDAACILHTSDHFTKRGAAGTLISVLYVIDGFLSMQIQDEIWMRRRRRS
jgi:hypothetical protein